MFAECVTKTSRTAESALKFKDTVAQMDRPSCLSQESRWGFFVFWTAYTLQQNLKHEKNEFSHLGYAGGLLDFYQSNKSNRFWSVSEATAAERHCN